MTTMPEAGAAPAVPVVDSIRDLWRRWPDWDFYIVQRTVDYTEIRGANEKETLWVIRPTLAEAAQALAAALVAAGYEAKES